MSRRPQIPGEGCLSHPGRAPAEPRVSVCSLLLLHACNPASSDPLSISFPLAPVTASSGPGHSCPAVLASSRPPVLCTCVADRVFLRCTHRDVLWPEPSSHCLQTKSDPRAWCPWSPRTRPDFCLEPRPHTSLHRAALRAWLSAPPGLCTLRTPSPLPASPTHPYWLGCVVPSLIFPPPPGPSSVLLSLRS